MFHERCVSCQLLQNGTSWVFIDDFTNLLHVYVWLLVEGWPECSQSATEVSTRLNQENRSKVCVIFMALSSEAVLSISYVSNAVFPSCK
jgi:hypothetical protein